MPLNCTVIVLDVNGTPVPGAQVAVGAQRGATDQAGRWATTLADPTATPLIQVNHPNYVPENQAYAGDMRTATGMNPLVSRAVAGDDVTLTVRLGRLDTVPAREFPPEEITAILGDKGARDPHAALLWKWPGNPQVHTYAGHWNTTRTVWRAAAVPLAATAPVDPPTGWARFVHDKVDVNIAAYGRFYWLLYPGQGSQPQHLVAVWAPHLNSPTPLPALDFVMYYSPHTAEYTKTYPYGLVGSTTPIQQYFELGKKYLLDEFYFIFELLAWRNRSVVVMPICNHGDWGPWGSGEAVYRLLREVSLFLHRQARTSNLGIRPADANSPEELAGPNLRRFGIGLHAPDFGAIPAVGKVAVSGFSTGIAPVKTLMNSANWNTGLGSALWGVPTGAGADNPQALWAAAWRELWDMDGFHPATGGWRPYLDLLQRWFGADATRVVRSYHSTGRVPPDPLTDPHPVFTALRGGGLDADVPSPPTSGALWARFLQNRRWTSMRMSDSYVAPGPGGEQPSFLDAHHTMARIAFAHAASVTTVGRTQP
ncbi:hypothetical protein [Luedemannella helvata]|uniref:Carboxypeptidase regulatory-like domain-containing protein n=1 Tax=Luedemannella helvata TaxID=349315 RepID=A0ABP4VY83_9ACTN